MLKGYRSIFLFRSGGMENGLKTTSERTRRLRFMSNIRVAFFRYTAFGGRGWCGLVPRESECGLRSGLDGDDPVSNVIIDPLHAERASVLDRLLAHFPEAWI